MKRLMALCLIMSALLMLGCANLQQSGSHFVSGAIGLHRVITLYSANGSVIQKWEGRYNVQFKNGVARFMDKGKAINISGTYTVIEQ